MNEANSRVAKFTIEELSQRYCLNPECPKGAEATEEEEESPFSEPDTGEWNRAEDDGF